MRMTVFCCGTVKRPLGLCLCHTVCLSGMFLPLHMAWRSLVCAQPLAHMPPLPEGLVLQTWNWCLSEMGAVGKSEQGRTRSDWSALVAPRCHWWLRVDKCGFETKTGSFPGSFWGGCAARAAKTRDNRLCRGRLFLLPGQPWPQCLLGTPSLHTHTAGLRLDAPRCLHAERQDRHLLLEAPLCGNAGH